MQLLMGYLELVAEVQAFAFWREGLLRYEDEEGNDRPQHRQDICTNQVPSQRQSWVQGTR